MQQNIVWGDGKSRLLSTIKNALMLSTLTIVNAVKHVPDLARTVAPAGLAAQPSRRFMRGGSGLPRTGRETTYYLHITKSLIGSRYLGCA